MKTKRNVGPLDKRKQLTRCQSCAKRRIKCQGGFPCEYCMRMNKACLPQTAFKADVVFITSSTWQQPARLPQGVNNHSYFSYFVLSMQRCQLTEDFTNLGTDLYLASQTCLPLHEATMAIGALEASRRATVKSGSPQLPITCAFRAYGKSIQILRGQLQSPEALKSEGVLWCTFLLGLFELMTETTGERWAKHMLYGTSKILESSGPLSQLSTLGRKLLVPFKSLEAYRAILFGEDTFLSQDNCIRRQPSPVTGSTNMMNIVFDLMIQISSFSKHFFTQIEKVPQTQRLGHSMMYALAAEGLYLQARLQDWCSQNATQIDCPDPYSNLAWVNCHALDLFLSKNFTYYSIWEDIDIPQHSLSSIEKHVVAIATLSDGILSHPNVPGILLLFALRTAGVNTTRPHRQVILRLLDRIAQAGFLVSERIKVDLHQLWNYEDKEGQKG